MKKKLYRLLYVVLILTLVISGGYLIYKQFEGRAAARDYEHALQAAGIEDLAPPPSAPPASEQPVSSGSVPEEEGDPWLQALHTVDLPGLRSTNSDILGWITIPDTDLSYPVLNGRDNRYYLDHTWSGEYNAAGAIFLEMNCAGDFSDFNVLIYGHRMHNNMMFGTLRFYEDPAFWAEHPSVYLASDAGVARYDIFAAYEAGVKDPTYRLKLTEEAEKQAFLDFCLASSVVDAGIVPTTSDQILTLSTCTRQGGASTRWVVQAVLRQTA